MQNSSYENIQAVHFTSRQIMPYLSEGRKPKTQMKFQKSNKRPDIHPKGAFQKSPLSSLLTMSLYL